MTARELLKGIECPTPLSEVFFHQSNIDLIQKAVIGRTYKLTGVIIPAQDESNVKIVMRSVYLQLSPTLRGNLKANLKELDAVTIDEILADIIPTIQMQTHYETTINGPTSVIERPAYTSKKGTDCVKHSRVLM